MRSLYNNQLQIRMYSPLSYEESVKYIDCYYHRPKTAFNHSVIQIVNIKSNGECEYIEKELIVISITPEYTYSNGGKYIPTKHMVMNKKSTSKIKKGRLVYCNIGNILTEGDKPIKLWVDKYIPYELTDENKVYSVMLDGWSPYTATNYGKYGTWNLNEIDKMKYKNIKNIKNEKMKI